MTLIEFSNSYLLGIFLVFCRLGSAMMFLPFFSDAGISSTARLLFAILVSLLIQPSVAHLLPNISSSDNSILIHIFEEVMIGAYLGLIIKLFVSTMHTVGNVISTQAGLSMAMLFDPDQANQNTIPGIFLALLTSVALIALELDHLLIKGIIASYEKFTPSSSMLNAEFYLENIIQLVGDTFALSIKLSMPFIIGGTVMMVTAGAMARLMPSMQVFFIMIPIQIIFALIILALALSYIVMAFIEEYKLFLLTLFG